MFQAVDTDIDSLDHGSAREYVLAFLTALKQSEKERAIAEEEVVHWERRVRLAEKLRELATRLSAEEQGLRRKIAVLRQKLSVVRERASFAVDAVELLAQLRQLAGEQG